MADGLDDLLDEIEAKFCRSISVSSQFASDCKDPAGKPRNYSTASTLNQREVEDIHFEAVLQEILDDNVGQSASSLAPILSKTHAMVSCPQTTSVKCCPVYLGGSSIRSGIGTSITQRACDQLRCTCCDFQVVTFDDFEWDSSCDYLFFRNNMPDHSKLRVKLKKRRGARAYACQCSWHSAFTLSDLRDTQHKLLVELWEWRY